jgi:hypothetical protein
MKLFNKDAINKTEVFNKVLKSLGLIVVGIIGTLLTQTILDYRNRPKISSNFTFLIIEKSLDDTWSVNTDLHLKNEGKNKTAIEILKILVTIPALNKRPYSIPISKTYSIDDFGTIDDNLKGFFPDDLDTISDCPKIKSVKIIYKSFSARKEKEISKDSSDIKWSAIFGGYDEEKKEITFINPPVIEPPFKNDSLTLDMFGNYDLLYHGKKYTINYYPAIIPLSHTIKGDRILLYPKLKIGLGINATQDQLVIPTSYIINTSKEIAKKIEFSEDMSLSLITKTKEDGENVINEFVMRMKDKKGGIIYQFK